MSLSTTSLVRRHMKHSPAFVLSEDQTTLPIPIALEPGEVLVGWYRNPSPWEGSIVVFTTLAVYGVEGGLASRIGFDEIVSYETPEDKQSATGVRIGTSGGFRFIRMAGRYGPDMKFGDVFNFMMILQVLLAKRSSNGPENEQKNHEKR